MVELTGKKTLETDEWAVGWSGDRIEICVKGADEHRIALDIDGTSAIDRMLAEMYRRKMDA